MAKRTIIGLFSVLFLGSLAQAQEQIQLSCANSARDSVIDKAAESFTKETGIKIIQPGAERRGSVTTYFKDLLEGRAEAVCASATFDDWVQALQKEGGSVPKDMQLAHRVVGKDLIYTITHKTAGVKELTKENLVSIFSGDVKNWKQVGGADMAITIVTSKDKANTRNSFARMILGKKEFRKDVVEVEMTPDMLKKLEATPGGVSIFSEAYTSASVAMVKTPDIGRPVTLVNKGRPSPALEKFIQHVRKVNAVN